MLQTDFSLQVDSKVPTREWFRSHHSQATKSTMSRFPVLTVTSMLIGCWMLMWSTECAPLPSKPINATRKIPPSPLNPTVSTTVATTKVEQSAFQSQVTKLEAVNLSSPSASGTFNAARPEAIVSRGNTTVDGIDGHQHTSSTDRRDVDAVVRSQTHLSVSSQFRK